MTVGERLKAARKRSGKSQADIAKETGRTQPTVSTWENDQALPDTKDIRAVARAYGIRPDHLLPEDAA